MWPGHSLHPPTTGITAYQEGEKHEQHCVIVNTQKLQNSSTLNVNITSDYESTSAQRST